MKYFKKRICCIILFCMIFNPLYVHASQLPDNEHIMPIWENAEDYIQYIACLFGAGFRLDIEWLMNNNDYIKWKNNLKDGNYYWIEDGLVHFSDECVDVVKDICDQYIIECGDYSFVPTITLADCVDATVKMDSVLYNRYVDEVNSKGIVAFYTVRKSYLSTSSIAYIYDFESSFLCKNIVDDIFGYDASGLKISSFPNFSVRYNSSDKTFFSPEYSVCNGKYIFSFELGYITSTDGSYYLCIVSSDGRYLKVWNSVEALQRYLRGQAGNSAIYVTDNYTNYNVSEDNSITINRETLNNIVNNDLSTDIGELVTNINQSLNSYYIENGTSMSQTDIQQVIDQSVQNLINNYYVSVTPPDKPPVDPDKPDPPGGDVSGNNPGGSVSGNGVDGPQTVSFLSKIYLKLCEVYDFLSGSILDALKSIKNAIVANTLVDVAGGIADLISGGLDAVDGFMDDTAEAFSPVAEMLPEKFPTCIPWDLIAVFTVIVSSGSPPVYEVPVSVPSLGIDYTLTLDLSIFEPVATLCRAFLSLLMVMMLIHMTIRLTSSGGDNL